MFGRLQLGAVRDHPRTTIELGVTDGFDGLRHYERGRFRRAAQTPFLGATEGGRWRAIAELFFGPSAAARALPPFSPPRRPSATAWGFLDGSTGFFSSGLNFGACSHVDSSMI